MTVKFLIWLTCTGILNAFAMGSECPEGCTCDKLKVDCSKVPLKKFPDTFPENATILNLVDCGLKEIDRKALEQLNTIQQLCLQLNNLTKLNSEIFKPMTNLRRMDISHNQISEVHKRAFTGLSELNGLVLTGNRIKELNGALSRTHKLTFLNLANNRLTKIRDEFEKLVKLKLLDLGANQITTIHPKAFESLTELRYLILQNNKLKSIDALIFSSKILSMVDFTSNSLVHMPRGMPASVTDLRAGENEIEAIEKDDVANMTQLQLLTLNGNRIARIHDDAFKDTKNLKEIWLTGNMLSTLPKVWPTGLVRLFLNLNNISKIERDSFGNHLRLEYLTLEMNQITHIARKSLSKLKRLTFLNLQGNQLPQLSKEVFVGMDSLKTLTLANNPIAKVEMNALGDLKELVKLDMSYNEPDGVRLNMDIFKAMPKLRELNLMFSSELARTLLNQIKNSEISPVPSVKIIDLSYDNLQQLPAEFPKTFPNLVILKLNNNAWHCVSTLLWMKKWLASSGIVFSNDKDDPPSCYTPFHLRGKVITEVPDEDFLTPTKPAKNKDEREENRAKAGNLAGWVRENQLTTDDTGKVHLTAVGVMGQIFHEDNKIKKTSRKKRKKGNRKDHGKKDGDNHRQQWLTFN